MTIVTLIAAPGALDPQLVLSLQSAFGGGVANWLAPDEAAEFAVQTAPVNFRQVWQSAQEMGVDINLVPAQGRRKAVLLADMDSTMIQQECIDELAAEAGVGEQVARITARAMNGEVDFEGALIERVGLLKGLDRGVIDKVLERRISLMPGARELVATMKAHGAYAALVSGGFTAFTAHVAGTLGFDENRANTLLIEGGKLTGKPALPILGRDAKVAALNEIAKERGLSRGDVLAVGDGANDLGMLGLAGMGVALHAKPAVQAECELRINHGDLTALLYLQGFGRADFVTG